MSDIFDGTRRKIARHVTRNVAEEVLKAKDPEFKKKGEQVADEILADPEFHKMVKRSMMRKAVHYMRKYFNSEAFIRRCEQQAKRMIKDDDDE